MKKYSVIWFWKSDKTLYHKADNFNSEHEAIDYVLWYKKWFNTLFIDYKIVAEV